MEPTQEEDNITERMLRALIQQLATQIDTLDASASHAQLTNVTEQLEASLIQVRRVHGRLRASLNRSLKHEQAAKKAAAAASEIAEGLKALSRLEPKVDAINARIEKHIMTYESDKHDFDRRLTALHATLVGPQNHSAAETATVPYMEPVNTPEIMISDTDTASERQTPVRVVPRRAPIHPAYSGIVNNPVQATNGRFNEQQAPPSVPARRKRKRREGPGSKMLVPNIVELLSDNHQRKVRELAEISSLPQVAKEVLKRLLPCPKGGVWDKDRIYDCFHSLSRDDPSNENMLRLERAMLTQWSPAWRCARGAALGNMDVVNPKGTCGACSPHTWCIQLRRAAKIGPLWGYFYVRVLFKE
ncbi:hypothetical protein C7999DRAFT_15352 [Corynascus novoguineensis]|uniref:Uncharacterized protein n=1 Tax=Corynascus novoguineensis TaxID=1126955 RepID=A0AAN7CSM5_9PEZI|nr:hypothetical protein C7999DRAFT_15352 [Corynascus novoguineensis]